MRVFRRGGAKFIYLDTRLMRGEILTPDGDGQLNVDGRYFTPVTVGPPFVINGTPYYILTDWSLPRTVGPDEIVSLGFLNDEYYRRVIVNAINGILRERREELNRRLGAEYFPPEIDYSVPSEVLEDYIAVLRRLGLEVRVKVRGRPVVIKPSVDIVPNIVDKILVNAEHEVTAGAVITDEALLRVEKREEGPNWIKWLIIAGAALVGFFFVLPMFLRMLGGAVQVIHP